MKPEKILYAMNDIDGQFIQEAADHTETPRRRSHRFAALIAAVIALMAMTATAFAAEEIAGWFKEYFAKKSEIPLTPDQVQFIEENEQVIAQNQTNDAYSLELKSVLSDSNSILVTLRITAPTDLPFDERTTIASQGIDFYDQNRKPPQTMGLQLIDDMDGLKNTADLILDFNPANWNTGKLWTLHIDELCMDIYNEAYEQELLATKYAGQENIMFTDEEAAEVHRLVTLAEGPWEFTIDLGDAGSEELELIAAPVTAQSCCGFKPDGTAVFEELTITSFILRPLGATIQTEYTESRSAPDFTSGGENPICVVMEDGSCIQLLSDWGMTGTAHLKAASPIILEDVDHILLADGTKLMVP